MPGFVGEKKHAINSDFPSANNVCRRSVDPFYIERYNMKWGKFLVHTVVKLFLLFYILYDFFKNLPPVIFFVIC